MGLEEMFGGKKNSKKAYEDIEEELDATREFIRSTQLKKTATGYSGELEGSYNFLINHEARAKQRLGELREKGQKEANKMNEEYDRLMARVQEAMKAVKDFEIDKLGMSEETKH